MKHAFDHESHESHEWMSSSFFMCQRFAGRSQAPPGNACLEALPQYSWTGVTNTLSSPFTLKTPSEMHNSTPRHSRERGNPGWPRLIPGFRVMAATKQAAMPGMTVLSCSGAPQVLSW